jgi:transcriptional regulator with PAS, ATPase and Fis domain
MLSTAVQQAREPFGLVGKSLPMQEVMSRANVLARSRVVVVIVGRTGTGKEEIARYIHFQSGASAECFIQVNCAAISPHLFESEFFGHEKGAFTGSCELKRGLFEIAAGGTIFLDEIGDMPLEQQRGLLIALQGSYRRVGGTKLLEMNARVIVATNCDLAQAVRDGRFREDLYYRLMVVPIKMPALRDRQEDIPELIELLCRRRGFQFIGSCRTDSSDDAMQWLLEYGWPGNVRQLENAIQRAGLLFGDDSGMITPHDIVRAVVDFEEFEPRSSGKPIPHLGFFLKKDGRRLSLREVCDSYILEVWNGLENQTAMELGKILGIARKTAWIHIKRLGIR